MLTQNTTFAQIPVVVSLISRTFVFCVWTISRTHAMSRSILDGRSVLGESSTLVHHLYLKRLCRLNTRLLELFALKRFLFLFLKRIAIDVIPVVVYTCTLMCFAEFLNSANTSIVGFYRKTSNNIQLLFRLRLCLGVGLWLSYFQIYTISFI